MLDFEKPKAQFDLVLKANTRHALPGLTSSYQKAQLGLQKSKLGPNTTKKDIEESQKFFNLYFLAIRFVKSIFLDL